jgi:PD-(D/E)XK nuclease superfamily
VGSGGPSIWQELGVVPLLFWGHPKRRAGMDIAKVRQFVSDTRVQYCSRLGESQNIFDIIGMNENGHSNFLAWLLNPNESHGLGDSFFHELLRQVLAAYEDSDGMYREAFQLNEFFQEWDIASVEEASFQNSLFVEREFNAGDSGRIDLLLIDHYHELVVVIENKFGSSEHSGQLNRYYQFLNGDRFEGYDLTFVYLDPDANEKFESGDAKFKHWVGLDYEWIENFCERVVDRDILPEKANYLVKDYLQYLTAEEYGSEPSDEMDNYVSDLLAEYGDLIEAFKTHKIDVEGKGAVELVDPSVVELAEYIPLIENDDDLLITKIYLKCCDLIDHLIYLEKTTYLEKIIVEKCPGNNFEFESADNFFGVFNLSWERFANDLAESEDRWCLYVGLVFDKDLENRAATIKLWVNGKYLKSQHIDAVLQVVKNKFGFKRKRFSDGSNTIKIAEAIEGEAEAVDRLIAVIQKLSQALQAV